MSDLQGGLPDADRATEGDREPVANFDAASDAHLDAHRDGVTHTHSHTYGDRYGEPGAVLHSIWHANPCTEPHCVKYADPTTDRDAWWRRVLRGLDPTAPR